MKTRMTETTSTRGHIYKSCNWDCIICFLHIDLKIDRYKMNHFKMKQYHVCTILKIFQKKSFSMNRAKQEKGLIIYLFEK